MANPSPANWRPGWRRNPSKVAIHGAAGKNMIGFVELPNIKLAIFKNEQETPPDDAVIQEEGPEVILSATRGTHNISVRLTQFTEDELNAYMAIVNEAFAHALEIVKRRDEVAEESRINGDAQFFRSYRPRPGVFIKARKLPEHGKGIHGRPSDVLPGE